MTDYAARVVKGTSIVLVMAILSAGIGYLTRLYLARTFSVEDYGLFYAVLTFLSLFTFLKELGLNTALVRYIPAFLVRSERTKVKTAIFSVLVVEFILALSIAMFFIFSAQYWAVNYFKTEKAVLPLQIVAVSFFISIFMSILQATFQGFGKMKYYAIIEPLRIIFVFASLIGLIGLGVVGAAYAYLIASVIVPIIILIVALRVLPKIPGSISFSWGITKEMVLFGIPIFLSSFGGILVNYTDTLFLVYFRSLEEVGLYNVALPTSQLLWFFVGALSATLLPTVSALWAGRKKDTLKNGMTLLMKLSFFIIVPLAIVMMAFSDNIIVLFFGGKYIAAVMSLQILSISSVFYTIFIINTTFLLGIGKPRDFAKVYLISALCFVGIGLFLIPIFGIIGAAMTSVLSYFISMSISFYYVRQGIEISIPKFDIFKIFLSGFLLLGLIMLLKSLLMVDIWTKIVACTITGVVFYVLITLIIRVFDESDVKSLKEIGVTPPRILVKLVKKISRK